MLEERRDSLGASVGVGWTTGHSPKHRLPSWSAKKHPGVEGKHHPSASAVLVRLGLVLRCGSVLFNVWPLLLLLLLLP